MKRPLTTGTNHAIDVTARPQQPGSGEAGTRPDRVGRARWADLLPGAGSRRPETPARRRCAATARRRAGSTRHEPAARSAKPQKGRVGVLLADEFFFVAVNDRTGRPRLSPNVFGLGLAGALLGELLLEERITVEGDRLRVVNRRPPADALTHTMLDHLLAEPAEHPVRSWLVFLARRSAEQVVDRLWRAGHIRIETVRRLLNRETLYPPTDVNTAYTPTARLANGLSRDRQMTWPDAALLGLAVATGLDDHLLYTSDRAARDYLRHIIDHLTPALHALVWHLHAAVGDAVLTGRT